MTAQPPPPSWTVVSVLERSYAMARDNFPAFVTVTMVFAAVSLVVDVLSLGVLGGLIHLVCSAATAICITWGALQVMGGLGYSQESLVEYCLRRCRGWMIAGGSIEILKNRIAEGVFERTFSQRP